ncbi:putative molybdenum carrier protein [Acaryochloris sp. IP29b_bin.148]|uniref:putative molybdenum carrier protein n=1 Tax=Acaryochloris sp. IP29b_bin.148 TaxID=2969218 RepID=UPI00261B006E|nr:putative molybdenum carrier protein [Acaryochloris sp. IP29b_bin.148]
MQFPFQKIISGGQTGADRAALDWAIAVGLAQGGWCPRGRRAEDGRIPDVYNLQETAASDYAIRTEWNVRDSDATIIFSIADVLTGGTQLTQRLALKYHQPWVQVYAGMGTQQAAARLYDFVVQTPIATLNMAGPRQSEEPLIGEFVTQVMNAAFGLATDDS